jgi:hypothetical protein
VHVYLQYWSTNHPRRIFLDEVGFFRPKQFLSLVWESAIFLAVKSSLDALGEEDLIDVMKQVNQRRISDKEVLELYVPSSPISNIRVFEAYTIPSVSIAK